MSCLGPLIVILALTGWTNASISRSEFSLNNVPHPGAKRNAAAVPPLDLAALKDNPMVKAALARAIELLKDPQVQTILKSEAVQNLLKPENLKKLLDSDAIPKMATPENIKKVLATPQGQKILANEQVKAFIASDMFKAYIVKFKEILPQLIELAKAKVNAMIAAKQG